MRAGVRPHPSLELGLCAEALGPALGDGAQVVAAGDEGARTLDLPRVLGAQVAVAELGEQVTDVFEQVVERAPRGLDPELEAQLFELTPEFGERAMLGEPPRSVKAGHQ